MSRLRGMWIAVACRSLALLVACGDALAGESLSEPPAAQTVKPVAQPSAAWTSASVQGTLDKVRGNRLIYVGHSEASIPFSYMVGDSVVGFSWDLCGEIVAAVGRKLDIPALRVVPVPVSEATRDIMLLTGVIDLECGSTINTRIRQQSVAFGVTTFVSTIRVLARADSSIQKLADLNGKVVVTAAGTASERSLKTTLATKGAKAVSITGRDYRDAFRIFESGNADALVLEDASLMELLNRSQNKGRYRLLDENLGLEPYGIVLRRDDPEFKKLVDETLTNLMASGEFEKRYAKWFMSPIPPDNVTLNIPLGEMLKALLKSPNDKGL